MTISCFFGEAIYIVNTIFLKKKANFLWKTPKKIFRYSGVGKILKIPLFCRILLNKKLVIRKLSAIAGFSAILQYAIAGFYCTRLFSRKYGMYKQGFVIEFRLCFFYSTISNSKYSRLKMVSALFFEPILKVYAWGLDGRRSGIIEC